LAGRDAYAAGCASSSAGCFCAFAGCTCDAAAFWISTAYASDAIHAVVSAVPRAISVPDSWPAEYGAAACPATYLSADTTAAWTSEEEKEEEKCHYGGATGTFGGRVWASYGTADTSIGTVCDTTFGTTCFGGKF
jgi:hypothetical protein